MSEEQPPQEDPKQNPPRNGQPSPPKGPNWRVMVLFSIALGVLVLAYFSTNEPKGKEIDFGQFRRALESEKILLNPMAIPAVYEAGDQAQKAQALKDLKLTADSGLKFVTKDSTTSGQVKGFLDVAEYRDMSDKPKLQRFRVAIDTSLDESFVSDLRDQYTLPLVAVDQLPTSNDAEVATLKQLRKWLAMSEVVSSGEHYLVLFKQANTSDAFLEGVREVYPVKQGVSPDYKPFTVSVNLFAISEAERKLLESARTSAESNTMGFVLMQVLPILLVVGLLFFLFRFQMKNAGKGAMNFGKSKAKLLSMGKGKVTFKDVAGIHEAKEELYEIVDFLKAPKKFEKLGANIPKGVLMVGPPGTGKTLLARAIAGEAEVPFFSISGSDFVEMFVGVGASRVRDMFEQGKKNAPCIVFVDEIDAVGRHRGQGMGGGNDEREQTLNALLVEMDGFDARSGVIIIAATNRPDVLDPALLRPGRFDRQVRVSLPDVIGREQILKVHAKKVKMSADTDLSLVARGTPGFSGAELANLINEAALLAARTGKNEIGIAELEEARDKVRWGRERRSLALSDKEKENTAYHEAGHAILNILCEHTDDLHKVTIIPRGPSLGMAMFLPKEDKFSYRRAELIDQLCVAMGGRVAEEITFGNPTNGAMGDIRQATSIARKMVCEWGMSDDLGMVEYGSDNQAEMFIPGDSKSYSEETARKIDFEIKNLIDSAYDRATQLLTEKKQTLAIVAQALLEYETLNGQQIQDLIEKGYMENPPSEPSPPEPPLAPAEDTVAKVKGEESKDDDEPLAGEVVGAPA
ncbi:ATP-dependent zinc metalloprotease FtsH [Rubritalea marina]|uniref:ATP-dependent zinc metalloprotease FtsH n=1 Tax=Rubritalea marina TaxID=361055 RepID=UPI0003817851|nr:ATP-dependent zinc metalloprotease FtsH [Rubritalea marina]